MYKKTKEQILLAYKRFVVREWNRNREKEWMNGEYVHPFRVFFDHY